jgi:hypothetical protein
MRSSDLITLTEEIDLSGVVLREIHRAEAVAENANDYGRVQAAR